MDKTKINYIIDFLMGVSFIIVSITGLIIFFFLPRGVPKGGYQEFLGIIKNTWVLWHNWWGIIMVALVIIHLVLHVDWIMFMTKKIFFRSRK